MLGYLDDPEATGEAIDADGWLHTGDVGTLDDAGYLTITDRLKDMYISGGFNVYPAEVEQALVRLDGVVDVAVVGVPDERLGEVGKAYVVRARARRSTEADVTAFAKERLANFKVPREVEFVDVLPRNLGGKVLKRTSREQESDEPRPVRVRARLPGRGPRLAGRPRARRAAALDGHPRGLRGPPGVGGDARRCPLAVVRWPEEYHGRGASLVEWVIFEEEYYRAGAPGRVSQNGIFLLSPTIFENGTKEQQDRWLPSMATGEQIWAQAWSEPEAGSDLPRCAPAPSATTSAAAGC